MAMPLHRNSTSSSFKCLIVCALCYNTQNIIGAHPVSVVPFLCLVFSDVYNWNDTMTSIVNWHIGMHSSVLTP